MLVYALIFIVKLSPVSFFDLEIDFRIGGFYDSFNRKDKKQLNAEKVIFILLHDQP